MGSQHELKSTPLGTRPAGPHKESVWTPIILIDKNPKIPALTPDWTDRTLLIDDRNRMHVDLAASGFVG